MVISEQVQFRTKGNGQVLDITSDVRRKVAACGLKNGIVTLFSSSSTSALTTIEFESGAVHDLQAMFDRIVPLDIAHPVWMLAFLVLTAVTFALLGFIIGIWAESFEQLQIVPLLAITPLAFLGGTFYSIDMLPPVWQTVSLFNPVVYLISGFRWSFSEISDVSIGVSAGATLLFLGICLIIVSWIFKTGYRLKA